MNYFISSFPHLADAPRMGDWGLVRVFQPMIGEVVGSWLQWLSQVLNKAATVNHVNCVDQLWKCLITIFVFR